MKVEQLHSRFVNPQSEIRNPQSRRGIIHMAEDDTIQKCAHQKCSCQVEGKKRYCSDYCEDAADSDPTSECTCGHAGCK